MLSVQDNVIVDSLDEETPLLQAGSFKAKRLIMWNFKIIIKMQQGRHVSDTLAIV